MTTPASSSATIRGTVQRQHRLRVELHPREARPAQRVHLPVAASRLTSMPCARQLGRGRVVAARREAVVEADGLLPARTDRSAPARPGTARSFRTISSPSSAAISSWPRQTPEQRRAGAPASNSAVSAAQEAHLRVGRVARIARPRARARPGPRCASAASRSPGSSYRRTVTSRPGGPQQMRQHRREGVLAVDDQGVSASAAPRPPVACIRSQNGARSARRAVQRGPHPRVVGEPRSRTVLPHGPPRRTPSAVSTPAAFACVSATSLAGSEPRTSVAPTGTRSRPSPRRCRRSG